MSRYTKAFTACENKGFALTFDNGWSLSVQWGPANYGSNHNAPFGDNWGKERTLYSSDLAEIAAFDPSGRWWHWSANQLCATEAEYAADLELDEPSYLPTTDVNGYCTVREVIDAINLISGMPDEGAVVRQRYKEENDD